MTAADATTPAYGHPSSPEEGSYNYLAAELADNSGQQRTTADNSGHSGQQRTTADDPTTPAYGHPELRSAYRALCGPEEGSYRYLKMKNEE